MLVDVNLLDEIASEDESEQQLLGKASPSPAAQSNDQQSEVERSKTKADAAWPLPASDTPSNVSRDHTRQRLQPAASTGAQRAVQGGPTPDVGDLRIQQSMHSRENLPPQHRKASRQGQAVRRPCSSPALLPGSMQSEQARKGCTSSGSGQASERFCKSRTPDDSPAAQYGQSSTDANRQTSAKQQDPGSRNDCAGSSRQGTRASAAEDASMSPGQSRQGKGAAAAPQGQPAHGANSSCHAGADTTQPDQPQLHAGRSARHSHAPQPEGGDCSTDAATDKQHDRAAGPDDPCETCHLDKENRAGREQQCDAEQQNVAGSLSSLSPHESGGQTDVRRMRAAPLMTASPAPAHSLAPGRLSKTICLNLEVFPVGDTIMCGGPYPQ